MSGDTSSTMPLGVRRGLFAAWVAPWAVLPAAMLWMMLHGVISNHAGVTGFIVLGPPIFMAMVVDSTLLKTQNDSFDAIFIVLTLLFSVPYFVVLWSPLGHYYGIWNDRGKRGPASSLVVLGVFVVLHFTLGFSLSLVFRE